MELKKWMRKKTMTYFKKIQRKVERTKRRKLRVYLLIMMNLLIFWKETSTMETPNRRKSTNLEIQPETLDTREISLKEVGEADTAVGKDQDGIE